MKLKFAVRSQHRVAVLAGASLAVGGMNPEDIFSQIFGGGMRGGKRGGATAARRGGDVQTQINIPFMDAVNGTTREVSVMANVSGFCCQRCCSCA